MYKIIGADGKEYGPVNIDQLKQWVQAGRINHQTRMQKDGTADWRPAAEFPEVAALLPPPGPATPATPSAISPPPGPQKTSGLAITSFVLGLLSVLCLLSALSGIPAVICGHIARRRLRNSPGLKGGGLALAGLVLGYVGIALSVVSAAVFLPSLAKAKTAAQATQCANNMTQIGVAFQMWAMDHEDQFPFQVSTNSGGTKELRDLDSEGFDKNAAAHFKVLAEHLDNPRVLVCPSDRSKHAAKDFADLQPQNVSYRLRTGPKVTTANPEETLAVCPIHGTILHCDGSLERKITSQ